MSPKELAEYERAWCDGDPETDVNEARAIRELVGEVRHLQLCLDILAQPGVAGPPSHNPDDLDSDNPAVRIRAGYLRAAIWTFAAMAAEHPTPNYLAFGYGPFLPAPPDMDPTPIDLTGYRLEIAAVKPGMTGPSKMVAQLKAQLSAYSDLPPEPDTAMGAFMAVIAVDNDPEAPDNDANDCNGEAQ